MMRKEAHCISCGTVLGGEGSTAFNCPGCGGVPIGRCRRCRDQGVAYTCLSCGFRGP